MAKQFDPPNNKPTHEEIALKAYALFEQSGRIPGRDMENWLQAESQLLTARKQSATASSSGERQARQTLRG